MPTVVMDFGEGTLTFGGGANRICQVTSCVVQASNTEQVLAPACGVKTRFINERFTMSASFLQDWSASGISRYLYDNYNTDVAFTFSPDPDATPLVSGTLTVPRPSLGGMALQPMEDTLVFPIVGVPTVSSDV